MNATFLVFSMWNMFLRIFLFQLKQNDGTWQNANKSVNVRFNHSTSINNQIHYTRRRHGRGATHQLFFGYCWRLVLPKECKISPIIFHNNNSVLELAHLCSNEANFVLFFSLILDRPFSCCCSKNDTKYITMDHSYTYTHIHLLSKTKLYQMTIWFNQRQQQKNIFVSPNIWHFIVIHSAWIVLALVNKKKSWKDARARTHTHTVKKVQFFLLSYMSMSVRVCDIVSHLLLWIYFCLAHDSNVANVEKRHQHNNKFYKFRANTHNITKPSDAKSQKLT